MHRRFSLDGFLGGLAILLGITGFILISTNFSDYNEVQSNISLLKKIPDVSSQISDSSKNLSGNFFAQAELKTDDSKIVDTDTGVTGNGIVIKRKVQYYQWVERKRKKRKSSENGYTYNKKWTDRPISSHSFHDSGYNNFIRVNIGSTDFYANNVKFGAYDVQPGFLSNIKADKPLKLDSDIRLKDNLNCTSINISGNTIFLGDPNNPNVGDMKISYYYADEGVFSGFGGIKENIIYPLSVDSDCPFYTCAGSMTKETLIKHCSSGYIKDKILWGSLGVLCILLAIGFIILTINVINENRAKNVDDDMYGDLNDPNGNSNLYINNVPSSHSSNGGYRTSAYDSAKGEMNNSYDNEYGNNSYDPSNNGYGNNSYNPSNNGYGNNSYNPSNNGYGNNSYNPSNNGYGNNSYNPSNNGYGNNRYR